MQFLAGSVAYWHLGVCIRFGCLRQNIIAPRAVFRLLSVLHIVEYSIYIQYVYL